MPDKPPDPDPTASTDEPTAPPADAGKEAARYRRQLRDVEAQRDALSATVEALQRAEVLRQVRDVHGLHKPDSLWAAGVTMADVLADDGTVDADLVTAAAARAVDTLGLAVTGPPSTALDAGPRRPPPTPPPSWGDAISGKLRNR